MIGCAERIEIGKGKEPKNEDSDGLMIKKRRRGVGEV